MNVYENMFTAREIIESLYRALLKRYPDESGFHNSLTAIQNGTTIDQFLNSMLDSEEFINSLPESSTVMWERLTKLKADICVHLDVCEQQFTLTGPSIDQSVFRDILQNGGIYENHVCEYLAQYLKPNSVFIDIGANLGVFSVLASHLVGKHGKVISFEPSPINYEYLKQNISNNKLENIHCYNLGLWNDDSELAFESAKWSLGSSHILMNGRRSDFPEIETIIKCVSLDSLNLSLPKVDIIKMDIEGAELFALQGMKNTIETYKPTIVMELNRYCLRNFFNMDANDIYRFFEDIGYKVEGFSTLDIPEDGIVDIFAKPSFE